MEDEKESKELPTIIYQKTIRKSLSEQKEIYIKVSDITSEKALITVCKLKKRG